MAFQTSCASATDGGTGLPCPQEIAAGAEGRELVQHGSALFPIACYAEDMKNYSVAWHWHEEFEYILAEKGPLVVGVNRMRLTLQTGQGVFLNSGVFHAVEQAGAGEAMLHSGVFHPRLVGGMDTIFWQKLVSPLLQPGAPAFFQLEETDARQREILTCLRDAWDAVAQEPFDYENRVRYRLSTALRLLGMQENGGRTKVSRQEQIAAERMKQMLRFVEEHYAEELTVERIAACAALSESAACAPSGSFWAQRPFNMLSSTALKRRRSCCWRPICAQARSGPSAALRTAAILSRPSGKSSTVPRRITGSALLRRRRSKRRIVESWHKKA